MLTILALVNKSLSEELHEYLSVLSDFRNPIVFSVILLVIIFFVIYLAMRNTVLPMQNKMEQEKIELKASNLRLMAIFAELDPDPVIRVNSSGEIIFVNPAAQKGGFNELIGKPITGIISMLKIHPEEFIRDNKELTFTFYFEDKFYSVFVKGISYLNIAQFYMHDITELKDKEEELRASQTELKEFSKYLQQKIEEERKRISWELHDDIGQKMVLLKLSLQKDFKNVTKDESSLEMERNIRQLEDIWRDIRAIAHSLIPSTLEQIGLYFSVINLMETFELQSSVKGSLEFDDPENRLDVNLEISIFRIIQEAINNIVKYSKAREYNIGLKRKSNTLRLIISDDGAGFDLTEKRKDKGMGLRNMKQRAELHGGTFKIISAPMEGTVIMINFPLGE